MTPLIFAIRQGSVDAVRLLLSSLEVDVNEGCEVQSIDCREQEQPLYWSHPLFEACRKRHLQIIQLLLATPGIEVNAKATPLSSTAFCDACARGDVTVAALLLQDRRLDPCLGDHVVAHPALYACMTDSLPLLQLLARHSLLTDELEESLLKTARLNGSSKAATFLEQHYIDSKTLAELQGERKWKKIIREASKYDFDADG